MPSSSDPDYQEELHHLLQKQMTMQQQHLI